MPISRVPRRIALALLLTGACEGHVQCGRTFDAAGLQAQIAGHWAAHDRPGFTVSCGEPPRPIVADDRFTCTLTFADGLQAPVEVHVSDTAGSYSWQVPNLVDIAGIIKDVVAAAKAKGIDATLTCPHPQVGVYRKGERFMCTLRRSDGHENPVQVDVDDDKGAAHWEILADTR